MGEVVKISGGVGGADAGVEDRVSEWEDGLPNADDLTPLCQSLIPPELASAFRISPEPSRSLLEVNRASHNTLSSLRGGAKGDGGGQALSSSSKFKLFNDETAGATPTNGDLDHGIMDIDDVDLTREGSDSRKTRRVTEGGFTEEADSVTTNNNENDNNINNGNENFGEDGLARTLKRPRLVWTPQLHKRFVDVVAHLGIKNAVPKTIMQMMNVEGLTRENVASHLQKYRLYLKRMQGLSNEEPSSSDHLFSSTPVPQSLHESGGGGNGQGNANGSVSGNGSAVGKGHHMGMQFAMPYLPPPGAHMVPMPMVQMSGGYHGYEYDSHHHQHQHQQYGVVPQQRDWTGNKFGSVAPHQHYYHVPPSDK